MIAWVELRYLRQLRLMRWSRFDERLKASRVSLVWSLDATFGLYISVSYHIPQGLPTKSLAPFRLMPIFRGPYQGVNWQMS